MNGMDEMLKGLQKDYLQSLPEKISDIRVHIKTGSVPDLEMAFHKLKGTGKTYGIPEISELAAAIEHICHDEPAKASSAASEAVQILTDIHSARAANHEFLLNKDPRFKKLLSV
jgi:HPt (histidine-containing phosphotransfer) domain-containing protein